MYAKLYKYSFRFFFKESEGSIILTHANTTDLFFSTSLKLSYLSGRPGVYVLFAPTSPLSIENSNSFVSLENFEYMFNNWASLVKEYLAPSPLFDDPIETAVQIPFDETTDFRNDELLQLKIALNQLKTLTAKQLELTEHQTQLLNTRIDDLISSSDRINKKDLKLLVIGTIASLLQDLALDPEKANKLVELFTKALQSIPHILLLH